MKEMKAASSQCADILSLFISSSNVLELSSSPASVDTAVEVSCDVLYYPLEDSRAANNSVLIDLRIVLAAIARPPFLFPHRPFTLIKNCKLSISSSELSYFCVYLTPLREHEK